MDRPFHRLAPEPRPQEPPVDPLILLADDDPALTLWLERLLDGIGCRSMQGTDGRQALAMFRLHRPDLVVLDIAMPGIDGVEVCQAIKRDPTGERTPVILISSSAGTENRLRAIAAGADPGAFAGLCEMLAEAGSRVEQPR